MSERLFMFLAHGIAGQTKSYRAGARHALMLYAQGSEIASARLSAVAVAKSKGWTNVDIQRDKEIDADPSVIDDDVLRSAAEHAIEIGPSLVVYRQEMPLDS